MSINTYQKLAIARVKFQESGVKQSGKNTFAGYSYFELSDILPMVNRLGNEIGFVCVVSFEATRATLSFTNTENAESIVFTSPMSEAKLKGCHEVQNLGAVETYIKRYLYQNAFEIVENDVLNGTHNPNQPQEKPAPSKPAATTSYEDNVIYRIKKADIDQLEVIGKEIAQKYPNKTAPENIRNEYKKRSGELAPPVE